MRIELSPAHAFNVDDQERTIAEPDWQHLSDYIVTRLRDFRPSLEVRPMWANENLSSRVVVAEATSRAFRFAANFAAETRDAVELLIFDLHKQSALENGPMALQVRCSSAPDNGPNVWGEWSFLHGRLSQVVLNS